MANQLGRGGMMRIMPGALSFAAMDSRSVMAG